MQFFSDIEIALLGDDSGEMRAHSFEKGTQVFSIPSPTPDVGNQSLERFPGPVFQIIGSEMRDEITAVYGGGVICKYLAILFC